MTVDLTQVEPAFADSTDATVGIEEEFAVLDPETLDLVPRFEELTAAAAHDPVLTGAISGELISSEIEIRSGRGETFDEAVALQRDHRRRLFEVADARGVVLGATGTHPWADYRDQKNIETDHYRRVVEGLQYVARRNNTFSLHVHVGIRDIDRAIKVCDRLRPVLPMLLAISASSPCLDARDAGLHSARSQSFTKTFPRCGIPDAYGGWPAFREYIEILLRTNSIVEYTQVWWSIRPHFAFGTVEVRICDAQVSAAESEALAGLIVGCVVQAAREVDEGVPMPDLPRRYLEENFWRAIRFGRDGRLIDFGGPGGRSGLGAPEEFPAAEATERLLRWTEPVRAELGIDPVFPDRNGAQRQRAALEAGASLFEMYQSTVQETKETYREHPTRTL